MFTPQKDRWNNYMQQFLARPGFLSPQECEQIIAYPSEYEDAGVVDFDTGENILRPKDRITQSKLIQRTPDTEWIYNRLLERIRDANAQFFHFHIKMLGTPMVMRYEPSGFYGAHADIGNGLISSRKLSVVVMLTPPEEYTGGELIFTPHYPHVPKEQGTLVIFPSYLRHQVMPVTTGLRHTLVSWIYGPPFR
jgi:PKHD-type hydroxylase